MIRKFKKLCSINNLLQDSRIRGQVATYMLMMIGAALTFTLAMASLSQLTSRTTAIDDAADQAALTLASRIANKSNQYYVALGERTKICKGTGLLGKILAIIIVVIIIIISCFLPPGAGCAWGGSVAFIVLAALAGAAGGAIGGAIDGSGAARGALTGAIIGAALGAAAAGVAGIAAGAGAGAGGGAVAGATGAEGATLAIPTGYGAVAAGGGTTLLGSMATAVLPASLLALATPTVMMVVGGVMVGLTAASAFYNAYVSSQITADAMAALARSTQGLGEQRGLRESTFMQALLKTVDDPNRTRFPGSNQGGCHWPNSNSPFANQVGDHGSMVPGGKAIDDDLNANGSLDEPIPCFLVWWNQRMHALKRGAVGRAPLPQAVKQFVMGQPNVVDAPLERIRAIARHQYTWSDSQIWGSGWGIMTRKDVEGAPGSRLIIEHKGTASQCISPGHCPGPNGRMIKTLNALYNYGINRNRPDWVPSFYQPGPDLAAMQTWQDSIAGCSEDGCSNSNLPAGFDGVDQLIWELQDFVDTTRQLAQENPDFLATTLDAWLPWFYDPNSTSDYYDTVNLMVDPVTNKEIGWIGKLDAWQTELINIRNTFPACTWSGNSVTNPPCTGTQNGIRFWTVDSNPHGDFSRIFEDFQQLRHRIKTFRSEVQAFYNEVQGLEQDLADDWGGGGRKVIYRWEDARGKHWVEIRISKYLSAHIGKKSGFLQNCVFLRDYEDPSGNHTWIRITRSDPPTPIGHLINWNETKSIESDPDDPNDDGLGHVLGGISKKSKVQYGLIPGATTRWYIRLKKRQPM